MLLFVILFVLGWVTCCREVWEFMGHLLRLGIAEISGRLELTYNEELSLGISPYLIQALGRKNHIIYEDWLVYDYCNRLFWSTIEDRICIIFPHTPCGLSRLMWYSSFINFLVPHNNLHHFVQFQKDSASYRLGWIRLIGLSSSTRWSRSSRIRSVCDFGNR